MKLICLNIWGGQIYEPLIKFVREQSESTDIFCFQEVFRSPEKDIETSHKARIHILDEIAAALPNFDYVFHPIISGSDLYEFVDFEIELGQAEFVKKSIPIVSSGEVPLFQIKDELFPNNEPFYPENFGYVRILRENNVLTIINIHGLTYKPDEKLDCPERLMQSRIIKDFAAKEKNPVIICGDFNAMPETESIKMFEGSFAELVKKYNIPTTRSKISLFYGTPGELKFSDYAFVPSDIKVKSFDVPYIEISDHLPLIIEFS